MLKEHNDNRFTKEKDEVEKYLLRIIQRYFDIENNFTKESIEAMIIESLTRFKQIIVSEKGFIFSLNKQTGHITLTIRDFGGEPSFIKKTAFNKDFGDKQDTICEGNDSRLYDDREPLQHVHKITEVKKLQEELEKIGIPKGLHIHDNKNVLDALRYSGAQSQIDLIVLEHLQKAVNEYYENLKTFQKEAKSLYTKEMEDLALHLLQLQDILTNIQELIQSAITWLQNAYDYAKTKIGAYRANVLQELNRYVTKEQAQSLIEYFKKPYVIIGDGEIPITDGDISFNPVQETTEAGSGYGDSLEKIYEEGLRLGNDDWQWDEVLQAFVYQHNEESSHPMFISLSKYDTYTHRVTLASDNADNDCISVVLAYNEDTGDHLSLVIGNGGANASGLTGATANVILNYSGNYNMSGDFVVDAVNIGAGQGWSSTTKGVPVLIKKEQNNIKIWILYNTPHSWEPVEVDGIKNIYPTETPTFDFSLEDYPELNMFTNRECNYGYGCFSQPKATYKDVYFISTSTEPYGYTNITESKTIQHTISASVLNGTANHKMKLFFRYSKDGKEYSIPLPFNFKDSNNNHTVIQGAFTEDGKIVITTNFINKVQLYAEASNRYDADTIIVASCAKPNSILQHKELLAKERCSIAFVDSVAKNNFIKNLLLQGKQYYIEGYCFIPDGLTFYRDDGITPLTYTDWDTGEPNLFGLSSYIKYNQNKKWATADGPSERIGYIAEYKIQRLNQYFENPRIYYQVLGNKEVV
jgi:hypothetical protein